MRMCPNLRGFCLKNEWAGSASALLGVALLFASAWAITSFYPILRVWIHQDFLLHGLLFGAATLADVLLIFGLLCLAFSECAEEDKGSAHAYRGRRSTLFPEVLHWVESLGKNPRRHKRNH